MHDTADDAAIIRPLDPAHIRRQMRFDPLPLLIAKPKQVSGHDPNPLPKTNQDRIVRAEKLISSDPKTKSATISARMRSAKAMIPFMGRLSNGLDCSSRSFETVGRQTRNDERNAGDTAGTENSDDKNLLRRSQPTTLRMPGT